MGCRKCWLKRLSESHKKELRSIPLKDGLEYIDPLQLVTNYTEVKIKCIKHDFVFDTLVKSIRVQSHVCQKCASESAGLKSRKSVDEYLKAVSDTHDGEYSIDIPEGTLAHDYVFPVCKKHGPWKVRLYNLTSNKTGCPKCSNTTSRPQVEIFEYVKFFCPDAILEHSIKDMRLDIYIPSKKISIEFNGIYFHSSKFKEKYFHKDRRENLQSQGIRQIIIWEDDDKQKVRNYLDNVLCRTEKIFARKCQVKKVESSVARKFISENHLMGDGVSCPLYLGLFHNEVLVGCVGFRKIFSRFELYRAAYLSGSRVLGGLSKIVSHLSEYTDEREVISYIDLDKFVGESYLKAGFKYESECISLSYFKAGKRISRHLVKKMKSEELKEKKFYEIWNSGTAKVIKKL